MTLPYYLSMVENHRTMTSFDLITPSQFLFALRLLSLQQLNTGFFTISRMDHPLLNNG